MAPFAFRALPVFSARDATLDFEQLTFALNKGDLEVNEKGELKLGKAVVANANLSVPYTKGVAKLKFTASKDSATTKVVHGLGTKPSAVMATSFEAAAFEAIPIFNIVSSGATEFAINGEVLKELTGEPPFMWLAVA